MLFATATDFVTRLTDAHRAGRLPQELTRLRRYGLNIVDEIGYLPSEQDAANRVLPARLIPLRTASLILTSNLPYSSWGRRVRRPSRRLMIDRIVYHADVPSLKGASD